MPQQFMPAKDIYHYHQFATTELDIKLIVFDTEQEVIVQWIR
jgi:hypothetical protein